MHPSNEGWVSQAEIRVSIRVIEMLVCPVDISMSAMRVCSAPVSGRVRAVSGAMREA